MKIVFMIDSMKGFGGAQRVIANLCNTLCDTGNEVLLLLTGDSKETVYPLNEAVNIVVCHKASNGNKMKKILEMRKVISKFHPDVIVSFLTMVNIMAIITSLGLRIPLIISERNDPDKCTDIEKKLSRIFYRFSSAAVVQTSEIKEKLEAYKLKQIEIIPNPLIEHSVEKNDYSQKKKIVAVGRLTTQKNYKLMIDSFAAFKNTHSDYRLDIFGIGELENELKQYANSKGCADSVTFLGNSKTVLEAEKGYDFYLMTSDFEGMSNALAEAMSVGMPCIATDCDGGGARFLIQNGVNGILVPKQSMNEIVTAMVKYANDVEYAEKMGKAAKQIKGVLNREQILQTWVAIINRVKVS